MKVIKRLKTGAFNTMKQDWLPDGTVIVTLAERGDEHIYMMQVEDLYGKKEKVLWEHTD